MATYYVQIDTYYTNSPDRFVGPFATREAAQAEIDRVMADPNALVCPAQHNCGDVKNSVRIHGVLSKTQAVRRGMKDFSLGDDDSNVIGLQIPTSVADLRETEDMLPY